MSQLGQANRVILSFFLKKILWFLFPIIPAILFIFFILIVIFGANPSLSNEQLYGCGEVKKVSARVLQYRSQIETEMQNQGLSPSFSPCLLAQVMQESGGKGPDIFQASESKYGKPGMIQTVEESIEQGVKRWNEIIEEIMLRELPFSIDLLLQTYNFGSGYLNYMIDTNSGYSLESAYDFSIMMYERLKGDGSYRCSFPQQNGVACYGDFLYVEHIKRYLEMDEVIVGSGVFQSPFHGLHYVATSEFGPRWGTQHAGIDLVAYDHAPVAAAADGMVVDSRESQSYGHVITIQHENGLYTRYAHLWLRYKVVGQKVRMGEIIGTQGNSGNSFGSHLHFEIRSAHDYNDSHSINPRLYISFPK